MIKKTNFIRSTFAACTIFYFFNNVIADSNIMDTIDFSTTMRYPLNYYRELSKQDEIESFAENEDEDVSLSNYRMSTIFEKTESEGSFLKRTENSETTSRKAALLEAFNMESEKRALLEEQSKIEIPPEIRELQEKLNAMPVNDYSSAEPPQIKQSVNLVFSKERSAFSLYADFKKEKKPAARRIVRIKQPNQIVAQNKAEEKNKKADVEIKKPSKITAVKNSKPSKNIELPANSAATKYKAQSNTSKLKIKMDYIMNPAAHTNSKIFQEKYEYYKSTGKSDSESRKAAQEDLVKAKIKELNKVELRHLTLLGKDFGLTARNMPEPLLEYMIQFNDAKVQEFGKQMKAKRMSR